MDSTTRSTLASVDPSSFPTPLRGIPLDPCKADTIWDAWDAGWPGQFRVSSLALPSPDVRKASPDQFRPVAVACRTRSLHHPPPLRLADGPLPGGRAPPAVQDDLLAVLRSQRDAGHLLPDALRELTGPAVRGRLREGRPRKNL